jgi:hypothetical protein
MKELIQSKRAERCREILRIDYETDAIKDQILLELQNRNLVYAFSVLTI